MVLEIHKLSINCNATIDIVQLFIFVDRPNPGSFLRF